MCKVTLFWGSKFHNSQISRKVLLRMKVLSNSNKIQIDWWKRSRIPNLRGLCEVLEGLQYVLLWVERRLWDEIGSAKGISKATGIQNLCRKKILIVKKTDFWFHLTAKRVSQDRTKLREDLTKLLKIQNMMQTVLHFTTLSSLVLRLGLRRTIHFNLLAVHQMTRFTSSFWSRLKLLMWLRIKVQ